MKISADILRRLSALNLPGEGLAGVLAILADIQRDDDARLEKQRERSKRSRRKKRNVERDGNVAASSPHRHRNVTAQVTFPVKLRLWRVARLRPSSNASFFGAGAKSAAKRRAALSPTS
jgi:hypothetical protein